jgi:uncharacterized Zn finger protein
MAREAATAKGRTYLTEGRLVVTRCATNKVRATCRGDGAIYDLGFDRGEWWCTCPARTDRCAHLVALRLCTAPDLRDRR